MKRMKDMKLSGWRPPSAAWRRNRSPRMSTARKTLSHVHAWWSVPPSQPGIPPGWPAA